jgi:hypothetical protein
MLTDRDTFIKILQQANDIPKSTEYREISDGQDNNDNNGIVDYFMRIKNYVDLNELRFYYYKESELILICNPSPIQ